MKYFITLLLATSFFMSTLTAQVPQGISYQAIAFNPGSTPVVNGNVGIKISILDNSITGTVVYSETHSKTTNAQGLFNLNIGQGSPATGTFSTINWAANSKFLKVELDPNGGTNYTSVGTNQLMSVPFALYAKNIQDVIPSSSILGTIESDNGALGVMTNTNAYAFNTGGTGNQWWSQSLSGTPQKIIGTNGNVGVLTSTNGYAFNTNATGNQWWSQSLSGTPQKIIGTGGNIGILTTTNAYTFSASGTGNQWWSQSLSGTILEMVSSGGCMGVLTSTNAYAFNTNGSGNQWWSQSLSGTPQKIIAKNGRILVYTTTNIYVFNTTGTGNQWWSQSLSGTFLDLAY